MYVVWTNAKYACKSAWLHRETCYTEANSRVLSRSIACCSHKMNMKWEERAANFLWSWLKQSGKANVWDWLSGVARLHIWGDIPAVVRHGTKLPMWVLMLVLDDLRLATQSYVSVCQQAIESVASTRLVKFKMLLTNFLPNLARMCSNYMGKMWRNAILIFFKTIADFNPICA